MEDELANHILKNMNKLVESTTCSKEFFWILQQNEILDGKEHEELEAQLTAKDKSRMMYDIILQRTGSYSILLNALERTNQSVAASILKSYKPPSLLIPGYIKQLENQHTSSCIAFNVKPPIPSFTGRNDELIQLQKTILQSPEIASKRQRVTCIIGLGGTGKTELARRFLQNLRIDLIWLSADSVEILRMDLASLQICYLGKSVEDAGRDMTDKDVKETMQTIYQYISARNAKCLMVLDNVANNKILQSILPTTTTNSTTNLPDVIITSRFTDWPTDFQIIEVDEMKMLEATELVKKELPATTYTKYDDITTLVKTLHCFPLAIQQAISYIRQKESLQRYSIVSYLKEFNDNSQLLLQHKPAVSNLNQYAKTTFTTWNEALKESSGDSKTRELAYRIIEFLAYFNYKRIPSKLLLNIEYENEENILSAIDLLVKHSMIKADSEIKFLSINELVQKVIQARLKQSSNDEKVIMNCFGLFCGEKINQDNIEHGLSIWTHASPFNMIVTSLDSFPCKLVKYLKLCERYDECLQFAYNSVKLLQTVVGQNNLNVIQILRMTGEIHHLKGRYKTALQMYNNVIDMLSDGPTKAENELEILSIQHKIGQIMHLQGQYKNALEILEKVIEKRKTLFGTDEVKICEVIHTQISSLIFTGDYKLAQEKSEQVLECYTRILGADSKKVLYFCQDIAVVHGEMGNVTLAVSLLADTYEKMKIKFGLESRYTVRCGHNLALYLTRDGKHEESLKLFDNIYQLKKRKEGDNHPTTMLTLESMAEVLINMKNYDEAFSNFRQVHQVYCEVYGENNPKTVVCRIGIGTALSRKGMFDEALTIFNNVLEVLKSEFGDDHTDVHRTKVEIAAILERKKKYQAALDILGDVRNAVEKGILSNETRQIKFKVETMIAEITNQLKKQFQRLGF